MVSLAVLRAVHTVPPSPFSLSLNTSLQPWLQASPAALLWTLKEHRAMQLSLEEQYSTKYYHIKFKPKHLRKYYFEMSCWITSNVKIRKDIKLAYNTKPSCNHCNYWDTRRKGYGETQGLWLILWQFDCENRSGGNLTSWETIFT